MQRLFYIDFLRFVAIFLVTGFHIARFLGFDNFHGFACILKNLFINGGWIGCCLFFCISGYCLCLKYNEKINYFSYLKTRLIKILPAYYIAIFIWYVIVKMGIAVKPVGVSAILSHLFLVHNFDNANFYSVSGVFWFLGVLVDFYIIFPFLFRLQKNSKYGLEILTLFVFLSSLLISQYFHIEGSVFNKSVLINLPCFSFGILLCKRKIPELFLKNTSILIFILITLILIFFTKSGGFMDTPINLLAIVKSLLIMFTCVISKDIIDKIPLIIKEFITSIAVASYSIYLYNYIFLRLYLCIEIQ